MSTPYKTPILTSIYGFLGAIALAAGLIGGVFAFSNNGGLEALIVFLCGVGSAMFLFGIAQAVDFLGRTAHNTAILVEHAEREQHKQLQAARAVSTTPVHVDTEAMRAAQRASGHKPAPITSDDPDIQAHLARKAQRGG